jgi:hypothetical protein
LCTLERTDRSLKTAKTGENKTGLKNCEDGEMSSNFFFFTFLRKLKFAVLPQTRGNKTIFEFW